MKLLSLQAAFLLAEALLYAGIRVFRDEDRTRRTAFIAAWIAYLAVGVSCSGRSPRRSAATGPPRAERPPTLCALATRAGP